MITIFLSILHLCMFLLNVYTKYLGICTCIYGPDHLLILSKTFLKVSSLVGNVPDQYKNCLFWNILLPPVQCSANLMGTECVNRFLKVLVIITIDSIYLYICKSASYRSINVKRKRPFRTIVQKSAEA